MVNESGVMSRSLGLNLCYNRKARNSGQNYAFNFGYNDKIEKYPNQSSDILKLDEMPGMFVEKEVSKWEYTTRTLMKKRGNLC